MVPRCIRASYKTKQIPDDVHVHCAHFVSGSSPMYDGVAARRECHSIPEGAGLTRAHVDSEVVLERESTSRWGLDPRNVPQVGPWRDGPQLSTE